VGSIEGPIIGAVLFTVLQQTLSRYGAWYLVALGTVAILVAVWARRGLWGVVADRFGVSFFPTRRHLDLPAGPPAEGSTVRAVAGAGDG
jgi:branched-chain amino acid transport system permease protein